MHDLFKSLGYRDSYDSKSKKAVCLYLEEKLKQYDLPLTRYGLLEYLNRMLTDIPEDPIIIGGYFDGEDLSTVSKFDIYEDSNGYESIYVEFKDGTTVPDLNMQQTVESDILNKDILTLAHKINDFAPTSVKEKFTGDDAFWKCALYYAGQYHDSIGR